MGKSIRTEELTFQYDAAAILDRLTISVKKGTFVTIIGPNGSGKSTLLKLLASNLEPARGKVLLEERSIHEYGKKALAREMAVVPQDTQIGYEFTVYDIVLMGRNPHLKRFQREQAQDFAMVKEAMAWTNIEHLKDRKINELSGGERQRVIIARALAQEPEIILLDEPTSSLDIQHQLEILELLKKLNEEKGLTIIAVLHDINLAARYSQEILLLHQGKKITMGETEAVVTVENLQKAYGIEMIIERNAYTNTLMVHPLSVREKSKGKLPVKIHLICGGGTGKALLTDLYERGYTVTLGVVNVGDSDWEAGKLLGMTMIEEKPFSEISQPAIQAADQLAQQADLVILTSIPIGWGNLGNLALLKNQLKAGKPVYWFYEYPPQDKFDYTAGQGHEELTRLKEQGLKPLYSKDELMKELNQYAK